MSFEQISNPFTWAYRQYHQGNYVHPVKFSAMVQNYHDREVVQLLEQTCRIANQICVVSSLLTSYQRRKYAKNKINQGKWVFYLFAAESIPLDIFMSIQPRDNIFLYLKRDVDADTMTV